MSRSIITNSKDSQIFIFVLLSVLVVIFIANPNRFYFLNDDFIHIPLAGKGDFFHGSLIRPLSDFSLWIDYQLWKKNSSGYHLTNLMIHFINSFLVYKVSQVYYAQSSNKEKLQLMPFLAAMLFLVYAYHSEPLFWIIGRGASLSTMFFLLALFYFHKSDQKKHYILYTLLFFGLGLFVYETIWVFPLIVTIDFWFNKQNNNKFKQRAILLIWMFFGLYLLFRFFLFKFPDEYALETIYNLEFSRLIYNFNTLLARCFLPPTQNSTLFLILYIVVLSGLSYLVARIKSRRTIFFCVCLITSVFPAISLGIDTHDSESERFIYLATFFAVLILIDVVSFFKKPIFFILFSLIYIFHLYKLYDASNSYEFSSQVAKRSLQFMDGINSCTWSLYNLPSQYKGALIFRIGFPQSIAWINEQRPVTINIINQYEYKQKFDSLNTVLISKSQMKNLVSKVNNNNSGIPSASILNENNAIFYWDNDSLFVQKN